MFNKNPIEVLNNTQTEEQNTAFSKNNKTKFDRVSNYLSSSGIKDSFPFEGKTDFNSDKITSSNKETLINAGKNEKKKYKTNAAHVFDGKHGYYL